MSKVRQALTSCFSQSSIVKDFRTKKKERKKETEPQGSVLNTALRRPGYSQIHETGDFLLVSAIFFFFGFVLTPMMGLGLLCFFSFLALANEGGLLASPGKANPKSSQGHLLLLLCCDTP